ncbi:FadR/GntR family transcriptional regulator [Nocardia sp. NPDC057353]|uniref:FadR/GntR family transcriptional regulator n=1 Tax=Nocardia sp. NPDC057353 TaxID=3346104 RepID=UPI003626D0BC
MDFTPVSRASVSDEVFGQLVTEILAGRLAPGDALPAERDLAERFGVNRHAVREALKGVRQAGLVRIAQGGKTRVLDWRVSAGLDALSALAETGAVPPVRMLRDIAEMRRSVAADAARLCAERATAEQRAAVTAAAERYPAATEHPADAAEADLEFWTAVIDGSGNIAYRLGLNTLVAGFGAIGWPVIADLGLFMEYVDRGAHAELARRIAAADAEGAQALATELLGRMVALLAGGVEE